MEKTVNDQATERPLGGNKQLSQTISIIGRPNVGKSTLFNRLMGKANHLVTHDLPGVTRDRHYGFVNLNEFGEKESSSFILVDTGGFYPIDVQTKENQADFYQVMAKQAELAIAESDLILFMLDIREGLTPVDESIAKFLHESGKEFWPVLNKADSDQIEFQGMGEFFSLGPEESQVFSVSAAHGRGIRELKKALQLHLGALQGPQESLDGVMDIQDVSGSTQEILGQISIVGSPNVGKSTLLNKLLGKERAIVSDRAGTTVDPVEGIMPLKKRSKVSEESSDAEKVPAIKIIDTAGIRKQGLVDGFLEEQSVFRALQAIAQSDVVILLADVKKGLTHHDRRLCDIILSKGKSLIIAFNKSDLLPENLRQRESLRKWHEKVREMYPWLSYCDVITLSAEKGRGIGPLLKSVEETLKIRKRTFSTSQINKSFYDLIDKKPLLLKGARNKFFKIKYATQVKSAPPTFILFTNAKKGLPEHYKRYLKNNVRKFFAIKNTPIHFIYKVQEGRESLPAKTPSRAFRRS